MSEKCFLFWPEFLNYFGKRPCIKWATKLDFCCLEVLINTQKYLNFSTKSKRIIESSKKGLEFSRRLWKLARSHGF